MTQTLKRLADEYAHVYSFVGDDTMPVKRKELHDAVDAQAARIEQLEGLVAMQADALKLVFSASVVNGDDLFSPALMNCMDDAISATAEIVQAYRDKLAEPLRREVAMLHNFFAKEGQCECSICDSCDKEWVQIVSNTQATAQAYEQEVEARGAVKFVESLRCIPSIGLSERQFGELLRATSKEAG